MSGYLNTQTIQQPSQPTVMSSSNQGSKTTRSYTRLKAEYSPGQSLSRSPTNRGTLTSNYQ